MAISCSQNCYNEIMAVPLTPSSTSNKNTKPKLNISTVVVAIHMGTVYCTYVSAKRRAAICTYHHHHQF